MARPKSRTQRKQRQAAPARRTRDKPSKMVLTPEGAALLNEHLTPAELRSYLAIEALPKTSVKDRELFARKWRLFLPTGHEKETWRDLHILGWRPDAMHDRRLPPEQDDACARIFERVRELSRYGPTGRVGLVERGKRGGDGGAGKSKTLHSELMRRIIETNIVGSFAGLLRLLQDEDAVEEQCARDPALDMHYVKLCEGPKLQYETGGGEARVVSSQALKKAFGRIVNRS